MQEQAAPDEREGRILIEEIGRTWLRHGPESEEFGALMGEAIHRGDAGDVLYRSCLAVGEDGSELANDMRRHVAEAEVVFSLPAGEQACGTAVFAIPVAGPAGDIIRLAGNAALMEGLRSGLSRHGVFRPGSQAALLRQPLFIGSLAEISPDALNALRENLAAVAIGGEVDEKDATEDGMTPDVRDFRATAEAIAAAIAADGAQDGPAAGWVLGFIVGACATPVSEYDPPLPGEDELAGMLARAFDGWRDGAQAAVDAAGLGVLVMEPSHYDDAVVDGAAAFVRVLLNAEFEARHPGRGLPDPWDAVDVYAWEGTVAVAAEMDGAVYGPAGLPSAAVGPLMEEFVQELSGMAEELRINRAGALPSLGLRH